MMTEQKLQEIEAQAKDATTQLREAARRGEVMEFRQRDPLVLSIHGAVDAFIAEVRRLWKQQFATQVTWADEVTQARAERDAALDMVAEIGKPLAALSMPQIHRNADVVKALRQREIDAKETIKRLGEGIMQCIAASWSGTRSLDWTHPELILAEYVGHLRAERAAADEALAACQSQGYAAVANLYTLCRRMVRQKTDMQRDVLMCHATRIASQAGIPTGVMALLRDATPTDTPALVAERDRLRVALLWVEWAIDADESFEVGRPVYKCIWCKQSKGIGHAHDCQRQIALGEAPNGQA